MKKALVILAGLFILTTTSCARTVWDKPDASPATVQLDTYNCNRDVRAANFGNDFMGGFNGERLFEECMSAHGYTSHKENT
jgi:hypothetical protein